MLDDRKAITQPSVFGIGASVVVLLNPPHTSPTLPLICDNMVVDVTTLNSFFKSLKLELKHDKKKEIKTWK